LDPKAKAKAKYLSHKAMAKDLDFGLKDQGQGQGLTSLMISSVKITHIKYNTKNLAVAKAERTAYATVTYSCRTELPIIARLK